MKWDMRAQLPKKVKILELFAKDGLQHELIPQFQRHFSRFRMRS